MHRDIAAAIRTGVDFVRRAQLPNGDFPYVLAMSADLTVEPQPDSAIFPVALIVRSLRHCAGTDAVRAAAVRYLIAAMRRGEIWTHCPYGHPADPPLPPDVDDTACVSLALTGEGLPPPRNRKVLLGNRDAQGRFLTWILARRRWSGFSHARATWRQLPAIETRRAFFRGSSAQEDDVDAVVNANVLAWLGHFPGDEAVVRLLVDTLHAGEEACCDKWYDDAFIVRYFFTQALIDRRPDMREVIVRRTLAEPPSSPLQYGVALSTLSIWSEPAPAAWVERMLTLQRADGGWDKAPIYIGGRARNAQGKFEVTADDEARWGSDALSTALCLEALGRLPTGSRLPLRRGDA